MNTARIDTHHHIVPPTYAAWLARQGLDAGGRAIPAWLPESALEFMGRLGVEGRRRKGGKQQAEPEPKAQDQAEGMSARLGHGRVVGPFSG